MASSSVDGIQGRGEAACTGCLQKKRQLHEKTKGEGVAQSQDCLLAILTGNQLKQLVFNFQALSVQASNKGQVHAGCSGRPCLSGSLLGRGGGGLGETSGRTDWTGRQQYHVRSVDFGQHNNLGWLEPPSMHGASPG